MSVNRTRRLSVCHLAVPMLCAGAGAGMAQSSEDPNIFDRAHMGGITQNGGARRLEGDITEGFRAQVKAALEFARNDGDTLVILTAYHAQASQIIGNDVKAPGLTRRSRRRTAR